VVDHTMTLDILVPPLSQTLDTLLLVEWLKKAGEPVTKGEMLYRVETDKATLEVESPANGVLQELLAEPGSEVKVGSKIGTIVLPNEMHSKAAGSATPSQADRTLAAAVEGRKAPNLQSLEKAQVPPSEQPRIFASPRARQLARQEAVPLEAVMPTGPQNMIVERDIRLFLEKKVDAPRVTPVARRMAQVNGIDLSTVTPSRPGLGITRSDLEVELDKKVGDEPAAESPELIDTLRSPLAAPFPRAGKPVALSTIRKTIAHRLQESHLASASVTLTREVDATELVDLRDSLLDDIQEKDIRLSFTDILLAMLAHSLKHNSFINATFDGENLEVFEEVHIALAVDTERGLVTPVFRNIDKIGLLQIARQRIALVRRAKEGRLAPEELTGGTFTFSNLGPYGIDAFTPIINPPQVAILGIGRIRHLPAVWCN
jgi:pyruvate dehydrogenase E2 component (dihydrolipoamide acetyltransferase)